MNKIYSFLGSISGYNVINRISGKILSKISKSSYDHLGKVSQVRIQSYFILGQIILTSLIFMGLEIINAIIAYKRGSVWSPTGQFITMFGMLLGHHLYMLHLKKEGEKDMDKPVQNQDNGAI